MEPAPVSTESKPSSSFEPEVIEGPIIPKPKSKLPLILAGIVIVTVISTGSFFLIRRLPFLKHHYTPTRFQPVLLLTPTPLLTGKHIEAPMLAGNSNTHPTGF